MLNNKLRFNYLIHPISHSTCFSDSPLYGTIRTLNCKCVLFRVSTNKNLAVFKYFNKMANKKLGTTQNRNLIYDNRKSKLL